MQTKTNTQKTKIDNENIFIDVNTHNGNITCRYLDDTMTYKQVYIGYSKQKAKSLFKKYLKSKIAGV